MTANDTMRLKMPLLQPAQAQKHVTVNEALMRLDGMVNLVLHSISVRVPPLAVIDGQCWGVPSGAEGDWAGQGGRIAIGSNGGWVFVTPLAGMRGFVADRGAQAIHDGADWIVGVVTLGGHGSGMVAGMAEAEVSVGSGAAFETPVIIPDGVMVIGAVARVIEPLRGSLAKWRLGTKGFEDRFGKGLGIQKGSWARGLLSSPLSYYAPAPLIMTAEDGEFAGGRVRLAVHWWELRMPAMEG